MACLTKLGLHYGMDVGEAGNTVQLVDYGTHSPSPGNEDRATEQLSQTFQMYIDLTSQWEVRLLSYRPEG